MSIFVSIIINKGQAKHTCRFSNTLQFDSSYVDLIIAKGPELHVAKKWGLFFRTVKFLLGPLSLMQITMHYLTSVVGESATPIAAGLGVGVGPHADCLGC